MSTSDPAAPVVLLHGGIWAELDAERFWHRPGISAGLTAAGFQVAAPDRPARPESWRTEARALAGLLPDRRAVVVAGSNGCSAAVRLALDTPDAVGRLVLAWPATAGDPAVDAGTRNRLTRLGAPERVVGDLLAGETLRGIADAELATLYVPVAVIGSIPDNPAHQRRTVDALLRLVPGARESAGSPEPPRPEFPPHRDRFVAALIALIS
ncbi:alpha/beta fold hydrolase [Microlunatus speluncae]|uniref:alpha/beta fold hydrolase n=1 Tax=Microlunatus speluncae TaxID=2594267 RepID=UPI00126688CC|nr:alpha/beta hydrolase [Microlunatus speluncae]